MKDKIKTLITSINLETTFTFIAVFVPLQFLIFPFGLRLIDWLFTNYMSLINSEMTNISEILLEYSFLKTYIYSLTIFIIHVIICAIIQVISKKKVYHFILISLIATTTLLLPSLHKLTNAPILNDFNWWIANHYIIITIHFAIFTILSNKLNMSKIRLSGVICFFSAIVLGAFMSYLIWPLIRIK